MAHGPIAFILTIIYHRIDFTWHFIHKLFLGLLRSLIQGSAKKMGGGIPDSIPPLDPPCCNIEGGGHWNCQPITEWKQSKLERKILLFLKWF